MAQIRDRLGGEGALGSLDTQRVALEDFKYCLEVLKVLGVGRAVDEDVVKEREHTLA